ncbi:MAG: Dam family site-specific DNA-(adenine-N6)-methyltransferase [Acidobacteria bacterium]|nr:Dam family site-specific DNA-(adenine-N6)-methyltransferase [Acidobacteriota bacterium]MBI3428404.1 Dam family site-specific DNA-(adenine-N6)-methyltransferase [Acidobacteriota bacterium]
MMQLPLKITHAKAPPIKCQGIKTKLTPFILNSILWKPTDDARWVEPFLGSGVVALNLAPPRALLTDTNQHIIAFYQAIQRGEFTSSAVREFLVTEGEKLAAKGADYYYEVRERFNTHGSSFDFLFLNRSCFNGVMRFNRHGKFNVPFGHKPQRFAPAYITKIANQVNWAAKQMRDKDWKFRVAKWDETLGAVKPDDFVYLDPPYIGRHTDYYNTWDEEEAARLAKVAQTLSCGFALSMWLENRYRKNGHLDECWAGLEVRVCSHFYHVGSVETLRNEIDEALVIKPNFATPDLGKQKTKRKTIVNQLSLGFSAT